jgi:hypothetical protein
LLIVTGGRCKSLAREISPPTINITDELAAVDHTPSIAEVMFRSTEVVTTLE